MKLSIIGLWFISMASCAIEGTVVFFDATKRTIFIDNTVYQLASSATLCSQAKGTMIEVLRLGQPVSFELQANTDKTVQPAIITICPSNKKRLPS